MGLLLHSDSQIWSKRSGIDVRKHRADHFILSVWWCNSSFGSELDLELDSKPARVGLLLYRLHSNYAGHRQLLYNAQKCSCVACLSDHLDLTQHFLQYYQFSHTTDIIPPSDWLEALTHAWPLRRSLGNSTKDSATTVRGVGLGGGGGTRRESRLRHRLWRQP